jgi:hypothetical protein
MSLPVSGEWIAQYNEIERRFPAKDQLAAYLASLETAPAGQVAVLIDRGPASRWERFMTETKRDIVSCFSLEWDGAYASLTFHDDAWGEYRAIDHEHPVHSTEDERCNIAQGEPTPLPLEECLDKSRAFRAIREFLNDGARPGWLSYKYVP